MEAILYAYQVPAELVEAIMSVFFKKSKFKKLLKTGVSVPRQSSGHPRTEKGNYVCV